MNLETTVCEGNQWDQERQEQKLVYQKPKIERLDTNTHTRNFIGTNYDGKNYKGLS